MRPRLSVLELKVHQHNPKKALRDGVLSRYSTVMLPTLPAEIKISSPKSKTSRPGSGTLMSAICTGERHISGGADWGVFALTVSLLVSYAKQRSCSQSSCTLEPSPTSSFRALRRLCGFSPFLLSHEWSDKAISYLTGAVDVEWKHASSSSTGPMCLTGCRGSNTHSAALHVQFSCPFVQVSLSATQDV